ncbi:UNKNOWN [Stylonychia lemnae]|uniref:Kelch motif family protein n=1 Tax=Stylonychia lemnae TaxID=5949 RepID=A0A078B719_STYLE|nr:UNKNOWN [Stylonychia lemnae]|eukprot:CDW90184.1 UNKNOWN [Stylonychia lemnae]
METFDDKGCISGQNNIKFVKIQDVYKIKNFQNYICKPCYMRYLKNQSINLIFKELSFKTYNQLDFITSKQIELMTSEFQLFLLKTQSFIKDEKEQIDKLPKTYNINILIPQNTLVEKLLDKKLHSLQFNWLTDRILFAYSNQSELDIFKLGVPNKVSQTQILSETYLKYSTDYSAIARYNNYIFIAGGHNNLTWLQYLFSYDLVSEKLVLLKNFEKSLITPTLLCNKFGSHFLKQTRGLQFFYLGQANKFTQMNYYFMPDQSSKNKLKVDFESIVEDIYLNTDSINQQLKQLNFTYSYPAMFLYQGCYLVLFGGINVFTLETTNRLLVIDIQNFDKPKVFELNQEIQKKQGQSYSDYFFGNQVLTNKVQTFRMRGEHGIYKANCKHLRNKEMLISVEKIFNF